MASALLLGFLFFFQGEETKDLIILWYRDNPDFGYQANQSLISLGNGGLFGTGLEIVLKKPFSTNPSYRFHFCNYRRRIRIFNGHSSCTYFILINFFQGIKIAKNCTDPFGVLLSIGIVTNLILYAFVNAAVVTGLLPVTGLPMPMVSYGGSGMIINMSLIGILLNISL